jgi:hypothetical protein
MRTIKIICLSGGLVLAMGIVLCCLAQSGQELDQSVSQLNTQPQAEENIDRPVVNYDAQDLRDPFKGREEGPRQPVGPQGEMKPLPAFTVQGVIWGSKVPQAIINNKVVKVGDVLEGAKIISIGQEGIVVLFEGSEYNLSSPSTGATPVNQPQGG